VPSFQAMQTSSSDKISASLWTAAKMPLQTDTPKCTRFFLQKDLTWAVKIGAPHGAESCLVRLWGLPGPPLFGACCGCFVRLFVHLGLRGVQALCRSTEHTPLIGVITLPCG
jgi:hypothetical protein